MVQILAAWVLFCSAVLSCSEKSTIISAHQERHFATATQNSIIAQEGYVRCNNYMNDWLAFADPESKLVPRVIEEGRNGDIWNAKDCAADNYPFLVLTSFFTDVEKFTGVIQEMLENEAKLTSRVESLPDTYSFSKKGFDHDEVSMERIVFGTSEYLKDGLMPLMEWLGESPWFVRMETMLEDLNNHIDVVGEFDDAFGPAAQAEINGDLLQVLSRMYWMTGKSQYLDWAEQIGDYFLLGNGYPLSHFEYLRMRDHGCELVAGLCELYVTLHYADATKKKTYQKPLYRLLDFILEHGRNEDGLFYNAINSQTGDVVQDGISDSWGYLLNGYYSVYMIDQIEKYKEPLETIYGNLSKYHNFNWENQGADGFADAIEGAINLYNRFPDKRVVNWIDQEIKIMWFIQDSSFRENAQKWKGSGIIEGWYGDGNFARTTIMYNLWKSQGTYVRPWSENIRLGAEYSNDTLYLALNSVEKWDGTLYFDNARHAEVMNMPLDWPRINQFPEWFTVRSDRQYKIADREGELLYVLSGQELNEGIELHLDPDTDLFLMVY